MSGTGDGNPEPGARGDLFVNLDTSKLGLWRGSGFRTHVESALGNMPEFRGGALLPMHGARAGRSSSASLVATSLFSQAFQGARHVDADVYDPTTARATTGWTGCFADGVNVQVGATWAGAGTSGPTSVGVSVTASISRMPGIPTATPNVRPGRRHFLRVARLMQIVEPQKVSDPDFCFPRVVSFRPSAISVLICRVGRASRWHKVCTQYRGYPSIAGSSLRRRRTREPAQARRMSPPGRVRVARGESRRRWARQVR